MAMAWDNRLALPDVVARELAAHNAVAGRPRLWAVCCYRGFRLVARQGGVQAAKDFSPAELAAGGAEALLLAIARLDKAVVLERRARGLAA